MNKFIASLIVASAAITAPAFASDDASEKSCGNAPQSEWMSQDAITAKAVEKGYQVRSVKVEDGCYEVYAIDAKGAKAEVYFNPVNGDVVRVKSSD